MSKDPFLQGFVLLVDVVVGAPRQDGYFGRVGTSRKTLNTIFLSRLLFYRWLFLNMIPVPKDLM